MFVVYEVMSTQIVDAKGLPVDRAYHNTERAAKSARTKACNSGNVSIDTDLAIATVADFHDKIEKQVVRVNSMTGAEFTEPYNTPYSCSPASEAYFCT